MQPTSARGLFAALEQLSDPRGRQGRRHPFGAMLATIICATLCGARGFKPIAQWIHAQEPATWHWLGFQRTPPCANSFSDLLKQVNPEDFEQVIRQWTSTLEGVPIDKESLRAVSIDGKVLRGTLQPHQRAVHLLAAFDHQTGYVLSQCRVSEKTNEAKAALKFLKSLVSKGQVIIGDAMFCDREVCQRIRKLQGEYFVVVKDNHPTMRREIALAFADVEGFSPLPTTGNDVGAFGSQDCEQGTWPTRTTSPDQQYHAE